MCVVYQYKQKGKKKIRVGFGKNIFKFNENSLVADTKNRNGKKRRKFNKFLSSK